MNVGEAASQSSCDAEPREVMAAENRKGLHLTREPAILALLSTAAILSFILVSAISSISHARENELATEWFSRGAAELGQHQFDSAASKFRSALFYSPSNDKYQFNLAEALLGENRTGEAFAYLVNLREQQPENALVNRELARIAVQRGDPEAALRYFHNAIYGVWPGDQDEARRQTQLELIQYLLKIGMNTQARSELISLAANLDDDSSRQSLVGDLFIRVEDYSDALAAYRAALKQSSHSPHALAGAGQAEFALGQYRRAMQYLESAVAAGAGDPDTVSRLRTAQLVLRLDPFRPQMAASERNRILMAAFTAAGRRVESCAAAQSAPSTAEALWESWQSMKLQLSPLGLRKNPGLADRAMDLVFNIERQPDALCAGSSPADQALSLIAKLHQTN